MGHLAADCHADVHENAHDDAHVNVRDDDVYVNGSRHGNGYAPQYCNRNLYTYYFSILYAASLRAVFVYA